MDEKISVVDAARLIGAKSKTLHQWLWRHKIPRYRMRGRNYINSGTIETYLRCTSRKNVERVQRRPYGYITYRAAMEILGTNHCVLLRAVKAGEIRAAGRGTINYYCEEDVRRLRLEMSSKRPLPGWIKLADVARAHSTDRSLPPHSLQGRLIDQKLSFVH